MDDHNLAKSVAQWNELMRLRVGFPRHKSILSFIDHVVEHAFDARNQLDVDRCIKKVKETAGHVGQLEAAGIDTTAIAIPLEQLLGTEDDETCSIRIAKIQTLMEMRGQMIGLSMSTGGIDKAIVEVLNVSHFP